MAFSSPQTTKGRAIDPNRRGRLQCFASIVSLIRVTTERGAPRLLSPTLAGLPCGEVGHGAGRRRARLFGLRINNYVDLDLLNAYYPKNLNLLS
jgi:hypothetical protein